jgi:hypothetical protein
MLYRVHLAWADFELTLVVIGTDCIDSYESNSHTITTTPLALKQTRKTEKTNPEDWKTPTTTHNLIIAMYPLRLMFFWKVPLNLVLCACFWIINFSYDSTDREWHERRKHKIVKIRSISLADHTTKIPVVYIYIYHM